MSMRAIDANVGERGELNANVSARRYEPHVGIRRAHLHETALALREGRLGIQRDCTDERFARDERNAERTRQLQAQPMASNARGSKSGKQAISAFNT